MDLGTFTRSGRALLTGAVSAGRGRGFARGGERGLGVHGFLGVSGYSRGCITWGRFGRMKPCSGCRAQRNRGNPSGWLTFIAARSRCDGLEHSDAASERPQWQQLHRPVSGAAGTVPRQGGPAQRVGITGTRRRLMVTSGDSTGPRASAVDWRQPCSARIASIAAVSSSRSKSPLSCT